MVRIRRNWFLIIGILLLVGSPGILLACSLPAEPCGAAVPDVTDSEFAAKAKLIPGAVPYFLVPQGTQLKLRIVWDPWDHNGGKMDDKYDWVANKGNIPADPKAPVIDGKAYFPLSAMQQFFRVTGNNGSLIEAISRSGSTPPGETFIEETIPGIGPNAMLSAGFVKPGQSGKASIVGGTAPDFPDSSILCSSPSGTDLPLSELDVRLPNLSSTYTGDKLSNWQQFTMGGKTYRKRYQLVPTEGIYAGALDFSLDPPKPEDFKMYVIEDPDPGVWMQDDLPVLPAGSPGGLGDPSGEVTVNFDTPTLGAGNPIKIGVSAPGAGYKVKNVFWCWVEQPEAQLGTDTSDPLDGVCDSWTPVPAASVNLRSYKCSTGIEMTVLKPSSGSGFTAFHVYDSKKPIASKFTLENAPVLECGKPIPALPFKLVVMDSNPYADKTVPALTAQDGTAIKYDKASIKNSLKVYMSYPVYDFKWKDVTLPDLYSAAKIDVGVFKYTDKLAPKWSGMYFETKWVWREATLTVADADIKPTQIKADGSPYWGGMKWEITGTANFGVTAPTHFANDGTVVSANYAAYNYPAPGAPDVTKLIKLFAVVKDTAGWECTGYSEVGIINPDTAMDAAGKTYPNAGKPDTGMEWKTTYGQQPPLAAAITAATGLSGDDYPWQAFAVHKVQDTSTPPELQVIVFDTRNNRYHLFGAKTGGDAKAVDAGTTGFDAYAKLNPAPYSVTDLGNLTTSMDFQTVNMANFDRFVDKTGTEGGADTLSEAALAKAAFVCQQNTRLIFYIRAWDNINTFDVTTKKQGIKQISYSIADWAGDATELAAANKTGAYDAVDLMKNPLVWQFRSPNVDSASTGGGSLDASKECSLTVKAQDEAGKEQTLKILFAVLGNDLTIRSLEEKRNRK